MKTLDTPHPGIPKLLGIVAWAPLPAGPEALARYMHTAKNLSTRIKGVRYLLQSQPAGVMLTPAFIDSLIWLSRHDYSFDLGVDAHQGGLHQLQESCEMLRRLRDASAPTPTRVIINHLCKPNLQLDVSEVCAGHPELTKWREYIEIMSRFPNTYMKLSGLFSELHSQDESNPMNIRDLTSLIKPWSDVIFESFGPNRIMFGSDWPVCNVGGPGPEKTWLHWVNVVESLLNHHECSPEQKARIWSGTAKEAYALD